MRPDRLALGSTGIWSEKDRLGMLRSLRPLARSVQVLSDMEFAWMAAFGPIGEGILVLAGTGSVVYGRDHFGRTIRTGGLGPLLGDEGSAFWIGREWVKARPESEALRLAHRPDTVRETASLAKIVLARFHRNPTARRIIRDATSHLLRQAESAASQLRFSKEIPVACHGGLFLNSRFRSAFMAVLDRSRFRWKKCAIREPVEVAVARQALSPSGCDFI